MSVDGSEITAKGRREVGFRTIRRETQENLLIVDSTSRGIFQFLRFLRALEKGKRACLCAIHRRR
jgi:hypothetical protein